MTTTPTPNIDSHYAPIVIEHGRRPGDLLRVRKIELPGLPFTGDAWQIVYVSSDSYHELIPVSGIIVAPEHEPSTGSGPILVYCPRFHGLGGPAPSQLLPDGREPETAAILAALAAGFTVAIPDGEGMGVSGTGPHTFLASGAAAHVALDIARAARGLPDIDASTAPVVAWGYADGGRTAIGAAELSNDYAPDVELRAVAAGAVVTDPGDLAARLGNGRWSVLGLAGLIGLSRAHQHLPLRHVLTDEGRRIVSAAEHLTAPQLFEKYRRPLGDWCDRPDPWNDPMWRYVLAREITGLGVPEVPVHLYQGTADTIVPSYLGHSLRTHYQAAGTEVTWTEYDTDHTGAAIAGIAEALERLTRDLNCPRIPPDPADDDTAGPGHP
ncbi:hypothetical protein ABIA39_007555 [Nocardia sp. GAS34]|uniref:lipase family protein n=1 Tax=unclassified Nocardia TaxID=2637762 RepID=UPI003D1CA75A